MNVFFCFDRLSNEINKAITLTHSLRFVFCLDTKVSLWLLFGCLAIELVIVLVVVRCKNMWFKSKQPNDSTTSLSWFHNIGGKLRGRQRTKSLLESDLNINYGTEEPPGACTSM